MTDETRWMDLDTPSSRAGIGTIVWIFLAASIMVVAAILGCYALAVGKMVAAAIFAGAALLASLALIIGVVFAGVGKQDDDQDWGTWRG